MLSSFNDLDIDLYLCQFDVLWYLWLAKYELKETFILQLS